MAPPEKIGGCCNLAFPGLTLGAAHGLVGVLPTQPLPPHETLPAHHPPIAAVCRLARRRRLALESSFQTGFRPSDTAVGPDGALYISDWYDPRTGGHADMDDSVSGTIYRVAPKGFQSVVPKVDVATLDGTAQECADLAAFLRQ